MADVEQDRLRSLIFGAPRQVMLNPWMPVIMRSWKAYRLLVNHLHER